MPKVLIIADDLTGANDSAVQFAERGFSAATLLLTEEGLLQGTLPHVDVLSVSTESRNVSSAAAVERVSRILPALVADFRPDITFKKMDSTLRGNAGAEVEVVAGLTAASQVVVAPAYPSNGRTVRDGQLLVDGKPLSLTYAARDVLAPVRSSYVSDYFRNLASRDGLRLTVADAIDQSDLSSLVDSFSEASKSVLWVGSAGLARALAERLSPSPQSPRSHPASPGNRRTLVLFGSLNPVAKAQVDALADLEDCRVILPGSPAELVDSMTAAVRSPAKTVVIASHRLEGPDGQSAPATARLVRSFFSEAAERAVESRAFDALVISGGDVAFAVLRRLGASAVGIEQEILPGVALGSVIGGQASGLGVVTKAGGFGDADSLAKILAHLAK